MAGNQRTIDVYPSPTPGPAPDIQDAGLRGAIDQYYCGYVFKVRLGLGYNRKEG